MLFAARQLRRQVIKTVFQSQFGEKRFGTLFCRWQLSCGDEFRQSDIFNCGKVREQMMKLKDESDFFVAERGQFFPGKEVSAIAEQGGVFKQQFPAVRSIERSKQIEQRCFTASGCTDYREHFAWFYGKIDPLENRNRGLSGKRVGFSDVFCVKQHGFIRILFVPRPQ